MALTIFGGLIALAGILMMPSSITMMVGLVLIASLLGGAAAISLPSLGGASIAPASFALVFLVLRILLSPAGRFPVVAKALVQNPFLAFYCVYGTITAFLLPRLFFHVMNVPQLRAVAGGLFATAPVEFSSQNITTGVYLLGTLLAFLSAMLASALEHRQKLLLRTVAIVSWAHITFGVLDIILSKAGARDLLDFFRNANYLLLVQEVGGIQRVAGIFPEPSSYAGYGFAFMVLNAELWMRGEMPKLTGITSLALLIMLLLTTSSTAYVSIAGYALVLLLRMAFTPLRLQLSKKIILGLIAAVAGTIILTLEVFVPAMSKLMLDILQQMTFGKLHSLSGVQRTFWAHRAWAAFWASNWIGVGAGSLRSSGLLSAIAGSMGIIGIVAFFGAAWTVLKPTKLVTHRVQVTEDQAIRASFGWAAIFALLPALLGLPTPDPGILFGIFAGVASSDLKLLAQRSSASPRFNLQVLPNRSGNLVGDS
jgi:hypothetical protein